MKTGRKKSFALSPSILFEYTEWVEMLKELLLLMRLSAVMAPILCVCVCEIHLSIFWVEE